MSNSQCPYCGSKITYWQKLKPVIAIKQQFVTCSACGKQISDYWIKTAIAIGFGGGGAILFAGQGENGMRNILIVGAGMLIAMLLAPLKITLKECNHMDATKMRNERMAKEMEFNGKRVLIIVAVTILFMAAVIWFAQPNKI